MNKHKCEGCPGSGIRCPATPDHKVLKPPGKERWVCVEKCDTCGVYPHDYAAGLALSRNALEVGCVAHPDGQDHVIVPPGAARRSRTLKPPRTVTRAKDAQRAYGRGPGEPAVGRDLGTG